ncbi:unnamed protein product [Aureobasidium pullulans]|nr:unnamed protein product [Aureobasidium pullulans]CAD0027437.1 unnamed protein product [Aureobasidium pullulans]
MASLRVYSRLARAALGAAKPTSIRTFAISARQQKATKSDLDQLKNPPKGNPVVSGRGAPEPPAEEAANLKDNYNPATYLGTTKRLPEFALNDKVVLVTGAARGLGLVQAEALLEAGATEPSEDFYRIQRRAAEELGTTFHYRQIDVRDVPQLNEIIEEISNKEGRMDGLVAAAGIQQETTALEYTAKDANTMFEVNVTGVFMTAQAVAKQMIKHGNGGSMAFIASMSGTVANRVCILLPSDWGQHGIRVNTISPGYIVTAMVEALFVKYPERRREWPTQNMLGKLSKPEEYRGAAVFLISDASSFMTGSDMRIDGGHCAW